MHLLGYSLLSLGIRTLVPSLIDNMMEATANTSTIDHTLTLFRPYVAVSARSTPSRPSTDRSEVQGSAAHRNNVRHRKPPPTQSLDNKARLSTTSISSAQAIGTSATDSSKSEKMTVEKHIQKVIQLQVHYNVAGKYNFIAQYYFIYGIILVIVISMVPLLMHVSRPQCVVRVLVDNVLVLLSDCMCMLCPFV